MAELVKIPLDRDLVYAQILFARLRASGFELELLTYQDETPSVLPHLLVHASDADEISTILLAEEQEQQATPMKVCLVRGSGFLGQELRHRLVSSGHEVVVVGRSPSERRNRLSELAAASPGHRRRSVAGGSSFSETARTASTPL